MTNRHPALRIQLRQGPSRPLAGKLLRMAKRHARLTLAADAIRAWRPTREWVHLRRTLYGNRQ